MHNPHKTDLDKDTWYGALKVCVCVSRCGFQVILTENKKYLFYICIEKQCLVEI